MIDAARWAGTAVAAKATTPSTMPSTVIESPSFTTMRTTSLRVAPRAVRTLVVRQALMPVLIGAAIRGGASIAVSGTLQQMLFEISETDPLTLASVGALLVLVAVIASWVPAFRAARLGPVEALRAE